MIIINRLVWDDWNMAHIALHKVTPEEVEEVCQDDFMILQGKKGRLMVIGFNRKRKLLSVVIEPEPEGEGVYYPVTARPAARKERRIYQQVKQAKGGESA